MDAKDSYVTFGVPGLLRAAQDLEQDLAAVTRERDELRDKLASATLNREEWEEQLPVLL
jgi:hypothetical protein